MSVLFLRSLIYLTQFVPRKKTDLSVALHFNVAIAIMKCILIILTDHLLSVFCQKLLLKSF